METTKTKLVILYIPFLVVAVATIVFYALFRWTLDIKWGVLPLKTDILDFWLPFILPWFPILLWFRRRIRILSINRDDGFFAYQFVMALAMAIPLIISQNYLVKNAFGLNEIGSVSDVHDLKNEKYFKIESFDVDRRQAVSSVNSRTSGKNNSRLNFHLYAASPFKNTNTIWYGVHFKKNLSNRFSDDEKNIEYRKFLNTSENAFNTYNFQNLTYFERLGYSDDRDGFIQALKSKNHALVENEQIILIPKKDMFEKRLGNSFFWIFGSFGIGALLLLVMILIPTINEKGLRDFKNKKPLKEDHLKDLLSFLNPKGKYKATAIVLLLNMAVFVLMIFSGLNIMSPTSLELLEFGGNRRSEVLIDGEYWRLFSAMFIHAGVIHLIMNLVGLALAGSLLEKILGWVQLLIIYAICGLLASFASIFWYENTISIGASGAIFGLYGLILAFALFKIFVPNMRSIIWIILVFYVGLGLLVGFFGGFDNAAHIGGLISGFILGLILISSDKEQLKKKAKSVEI